MMVERESAAIWDLPAVRRHGHRSYGPEVWEEIPDRSFLMINSELAATQALSARRISMPGRHRDRIFNSALRRGATL